MSITASTLHRDSGNFLRNQLHGILLLSLLTAFITVLLNEIMMPTADQLKMLSDTQSDLASATGMGLQEMVMHMTPEQQVVLLKASAAASFSALIGNVLLVGGMLALLRLVSQGQRVSALSAMGHSATDLPRLLLLLFICTLLSQLGLTLFVVPGVILAIGFSLAPIIAVTEKRGLFYSMKLSFRLAFTHTRLIVPVMMLWLATKLLALYLISHLTILSPTVAALIMSVISNIISAYLMIYLFRLYMLLRV